MRSLRSLLRLLASSVIIIHSAFTCAAGMTDCDALELISGHSDYNSLVCAGVQKVEERKYEEAISLFEQALAVPLREWSNFLLLPRLALAHHLSGSGQKAESVLLKAELTLSVFLGLMTCEQTETGYVVRRAYEDYLTGQVGNEVAAIMCGNEYHYVSERDTLEQVLLEAKLIENYFEIKRQIGLSEGDDSQAAVRRGLHVGVGAGRYCYNRRHHGQG